VFSRYKEKYTLSNSVFISILFLFTYSSLQSQAFRQDVDALKLLDAKEKPRQGEILFIGSSSFVLWQDLKTSFPEKYIINRSFGGSTLLDQLNYEKELIYHHKPKQIVIYCGENDFAQDSSLKAKFLTERFITLFTHIRNSLPDTHITYVSMKPSPSRIHLMQKFRRGNNLIKKFLSIHQNTSFVDVFSLMLDAEGKPRKELFVEDMLHMNKQGYEIWTESLKSILK
jgi:lysophospholipase L1-like esterase